MADLVFGGKQMLQVILDALSTKLPWNRVILDVQSYEMPQFGGFSA